MLELNSGLLNDCVAGKQQAIKKLYHICFPDMYRVGYRYVQNKEDIQDIVNTAFLKILNALPDYKDEGKFSGWVKTITVNTSLDYVRRIKRNREIFSSEDLDYVAQTGKGESQNWNNDLEADDLMTLLHQLPDKHRIILNLFAIEGYNHKEISEMLGISEENSRWYVSQARKKLIEKINSSEVKNTAYRQDKPKYETQTSNRLAVDSDPKLIGPLSRDGLLEN